MIKKELKGQLPHKTMGLVANRHPIPTTEYIFDSIENVLDFAAMENIAEKRLREVFPDIIGVIGIHPNDTDNNDLVLAKRGHLHLYVTGLTAALVAVVKVCYKIGICLTLYHYDRESDEYKAQDVF